MTPSSGSSTSPATETQASNAAWWARRNAVVARGVASTYPVIADRAENAELWDVEGRRFLDASGGIGTLNVGHRHPAVQAAVADQLDKLVHPAFQVLAYPTYIELAERLVAKAPGGFAKKAVLFSTGAEAVENAIKIARSHTGREGVIAFGGAFHGRTIYTMALTGKVAPYKMAFGRLPGGVWHVPFPMAPHGVSVEDALHAIQMVFKVDCGPQHVAAILLEPVLGEGGFYAAPPELLRALRALCDEHGIVLIADEVQSGFARTGRLFATEHSGVVPDLTTVAKSLAAGLPLSGVVGKAEIVDAVPPGGLGGTYGGNAVACAAALAVLDVIEEEDLLARAEAQGARFESRMRKLAADPDMACVADVRRLGAMCAIELMHPGEAHAPWPELVTRTREIALQKGLIVLACGLYGNALRWLMPLTAPDAHVDEALDILEASLREAVAGA
ncbi:MAG: 4-aminobutyrate--2-oxoglutarate transaminase [Planctomycetota bacterium]